MSDVESEHDSEEGLASETGDEEQSSYSSFECKKNSVSKESRPNVQSAFRDLTSPDLDSEWEKSDTPTGDVASAFSFNIEALSNQKIPVTGNIENDVGYSNTPKCGVFQDLISPSEEPDSMCSENDDNYRNFPDNLTDFGHVDAGENDREHMDRPDDGDMDGAGEMESEGELEDSDEDSDSDSSVSGDESPSSPDDSHTVQTTIQSMAADHQSKNSLYSQAPLDGFQMAQEEYHPSAVEHQVPPDKYQESSPEYQFSSDEYQPPSVEYQPPSIEYQPPSIEYQPPSIEYQPPSIGYQPPSIGYQPPSVESQPSSLKEHSHSSGDSPHKGSSQHLSQGAEGKKEWDLFVSHSTVDKPWARERIIAKLRDPPHQLKVTGCYHYMPDDTKYDDRQIASVMKKTSFIMIGLSPAYLRSPRCNKEWNLAVQLAEENCCEVIVAAVAVCNRPDQLKKYLYLDFIDQNKERRENVWQKLTTTLKKHLAKSNQKTPSHQKTPSEQKGKSQRDVKKPEVRPKMVEVESESSSQDQDPLEMDFNSMLQEFDNPLTKYDIPQTNHVMFCSDRTNEDSDRGSSSKGKHGKEIESGSEEGEIPDDDDDDDNNEQENTRSQKVAEFYGKLENPDIEKRKESPIFHLRNFNNWVKSVLIRTYLKKLPRHPYVLDLCCGKGGDLLKWKEGGIEYLVCADIAETSVKQCRDRFNSRKLAHKRGGKPFSAEFIVADCARERLKDQYKDKTMVFNLTSCQFAIHYSFESHDQAHMMLRNACECLRPGGYFIGTTVDSNELVYRLKEANGDEIGNKIFTVTPHVDVRQGIPLFGAQYHFQLHGVVDLPEYLVHFPLFVEMLKEFNMELEYSQNFYEFFSQHRLCHDDLDLMYKMQAMDRNTGTMSVDEWEAIGLYMVFVFRKQQDHHISWRSPEGSYGLSSWDSQGGSRGNVPRRPYGGSYGKGSHTWSDAPSPKRYKSH